MRCVQARFSGQDVSHYIFVSLDGRRCCTRSNRYPTTIHIILLVIYYYYDYRTEATLIHYWWTTPCDATRAEHLGAAAGHKSGSEQDLVCTRHDKSVISERRTRRRHTPTHPHAGTQHTTYGRHTSKRSVANSFFFFFSFVFRIVVIAPLTVFTARTHARARAPRDRQTIGT